MAMTDIREALGEDERGRLRRIVCNECYPQSACDCWKGQNCPHAALVDRIIDKLRAALSTPAAKRDAMLDKTKRILSRIADEQVPLFSSNRLKTLHDDCRDLLRDLSASPQAAPGVSEPIGIVWRRVNEQEFEYAIQQGPHGDEFVKLLAGGCLRRPFVPASTPGPANRNAMRDERSGTSESES